MKNIYVTFILSHPYLKLNEFSSHGNFGNHSIDVFTVCMNQVLIDQQQKSSSRNVSFNKLFQQELVKLYNLANDMKF